MLSSVYILGSSSRGGGRASSVPTSSRSATGCSSAHLVELAAQWAVLIWSRKWWLPSLHCTSTLYALQSVSDSSSSAMVDNLMLLVFMLHHPPGSYVQHYWSQCLLVVLGIAYQLSLRQPYMLYILSQHIRSGRFMMCNAIFKSTILWQQLHLIIAPHNPPLCLISINVAVGVYAEKTTFFITC